MQSKPLQTDGPSRISGEDTRLSVNFVSNSGFLMK
jgi:hypothetical protein